MLKTKILLNTVERLLHQIISSLCPLNEISIGSHFHSFTPMISYCHPSTSITHTMMTQHKLESMTEIQCTNGKFSSRSWQTRPHFDQEYFGNWIFCDVSSPQNLSIRLLFCYLLPLCHLLGHCIFFLRQCLFRRHNFTCATTYQDGMNSLLLADWNYSGYRRLFFCAEKARGKEKNSVYFKYVKPIQTCSSFVPKNKNKDILYPYQTHWYWSIELWGFFSMYCSLPPHVTNYFLQLCWR
jgi:hypothetical protein